MIRLWGKVLITDPVSDGGMYVHTSRMTSGSSPDIMALAHCSTRGGGRQMNDIAVQRIDKQEILGG